MTDYLIYINAGGNEKSVPVSKYQHASFIFQVIMRKHNHDLCL